MDCPYINEVGLGTFSNRINDRVAGGRYPLTGSMEVTFRCNVRCKHCYVSHGHTGIPGKQELNTEEAKRIISEVADAGTLWFLLTGGEPFMRRDFLEIYTHAKKAGLILNLFTNGTMITPRIADHLAEWRPLNIEITLYGRTQGTYEGVTGIPGSYARCMRGIELLLERDLPLKLKTMVLTLNQHELWEMKNYTEGHGLQFRYDAMVNGSILADGGPLSYRIPPEEVVELESQDPTRAKDWQTYYDSFIGIKADPKYLYTCNAGLRSYHIDPYGELSLCTMSRHPSYDLRAGTFNEGWNNFLLDARFQPSSGEKSCYNCELLSICGQCPGWSLTEHGSQDGKVKYLCEVAHLRAEKYGLLEKKITV